METGISGKIAIRTISTRIPITTSLIFKSLSVLSIFPSESALLPFKLLMVSRNVPKMSGSDLIRLKIPPAATAPAPMYLI